MGEHVDVDVSGILRGDMTLDQAGDALIDMTIRTCNGRMTAAEVLKHREFVMTKLVPKRINRDVKGGLRAPFFFWRKRWPQY